MNMHRRYYTPTETSKGERNDCSVRAIATAVGIGYDTAHKFLKERFDRSIREVALIW